MTTTYPPGSTPCAAAIASVSMRPRSATSVSIIVFPTSWIASAWQPSASRCPRASGEWVNSRSDTWSVSTRLISSGIDRSKDRSPASTCPIATPSLHATSAAARVELTSPGTSIRSGSNSSITGSRPSMTRAVWAACVPEPTLSMRSGAPTPSSSKKTSDIALS